MYKAEVIPALVERATDNLGVERNHLLEVLRSDNYVIYSYKLEHTPPLQVSKTCRQLNPFYLVTNPCEKYAIRDRIPRKHGGRVSNTLALHHNGLSSTITISV